MVKSKVTIGAGEAPAHPGHVARKLLGHAMLVVRSVATGISTARLKLPRRPRSCLPGFFADVSPACRAMPCCCYAAAAACLFVAAARGCLIVVEVGIAFCSLRFAAFRVAPASNMRHLLREPAAFR